MDRVKAIGTVAFGSHDIAPTGSGAPPQGLSVDAVPAIGKRGTRWPAYIANMLIEEIRNAIIASGGTPDDTNWAQLVRAISLIGKTRQFFAASGSFVVPANITRARFYVWGAGGGSGGTYQAGSASLGGGGGGYSEKDADLTPGDTIPITVGSPGSAGVGGPSPTAGGPGGTSSAGVFCSATGGRGGPPATAAPAGGGVFGGVGIGGDFNATGSSPDGPFALSGGVYTSAGGTSWGGLRAHSGTTNITAPGQPGPSPGGGAAGGANESNGAGGGGGLVIVEF